MKQHGWQEFCSLRQGGGKYYWWFLYSVVVVVWLCYHNHHHYHHHHHYPHYDSTVTVVVTALVVTTLPNRCPQPPPHDSPTLSYSLQRPQQQRPAMIMSIWTLPATNTITTEFDDDADDDAALGGTSISTAGGTSISSSSRSTVGDVPPLLPSVQQQQQQPPPLTMMEPDMAAYASAYTTVMQELPYRICLPSSDGGGTIPSDLRGTYFRSGPAMFSAGSIVPPPTSIVRPQQLPVPDGTDPDRMVRHPFDGDGAILAMTFTHHSNNETSLSSSSSQAIARYRYVRTAAFTNERKRGVRLYPGMDTTRAMGPTAGAGLGNDLPLPLFRHHFQPGLNKLRKNTSNTRAVYWGKRLLTMFEGSQPFKLDARALSTEGRSRLGGAILRDTDPFGTKMSYDAHQHRALFYSIEHGLVQSVVTLLEFDAQFRLIEGGRIRYTVPGFALMNDFCTTPNYAIFIQPNVQVNPIQFLVNKEPGTSLHLSTNMPSVLHLLPRADTQLNPNTASPVVRQLRISLPIQMDGPSEANIQFCNAYEMDPHTIIIDAILSDGTSVLPKNQQQQQSPPPPPSSHGQWPWGTTLHEYQSMASKKSLWRYTIDLNNRNNSNNNSDDGSTPLVTKQLLCADQCSFGTINPMMSSYPHRYIYMNIGRLGTAVAPPQGIVQYDCHTGRTMDGWMPEAYEFCGEPMYAPRSPPRASTSPVVTSTTTTANNTTTKEEEEEDSGYILSVLYNGRTKESEFVVLQANHLAAGPITRLPLGIGIPHGYYGCYANDGGTDDADNNNNNNNTDTSSSSSSSPIGTAEEIDRRVKLADKMESRGNRWNEVKSDFSGLGLRFDDMEEYFGDWNPFD
jgi:all-trans-8'-apo-beta-carotenal 15,15'-oxygenase